MKLLATSDIHGSKALIYIISGLHVGSMSILALIKDKQPVFHIFGHIHEAFGVSKIDNTICCNVSCLWSDWLLRGYIIDTENKSVKRIEGALR